MKKILGGIVAFGMLLTLLGCGLVQNQAEAMEHPDHEKIDNARGILDKVLEHIADTNPEISFEDGKLVDSELGLPHFEVVDISEIEYFDKKDIVDGFIVRPVVDVDNPKLLIVIEAVNKEASSNLQKAMGKVKSDQHVKFEDAGILTKYLINDNKTVRQGNFLIYATWEDSVDIVKIFERHVR